MAEKIRIGSRGSDLALWQAHFLQDKLSSIGVDSEIIIIKTKGDRIQHLSFDKIEGKGFFTKEIEDALLRHEVDLAVHSHKDLETAEHPHLTIAGVSYREDPSELLLIRPAAYNSHLPFGLCQSALVGTSSSRRKVQLLAHRPDIRLKDIRGNVPTRVQKLRDGGFDAIMLAQAGVARLNLDLTGLIAKRLDPQRFIPAPAQGVLAYQCRKDDQSTAEVIERISSSDIREKIGVERAILRSIGGGCQVPFGALVEKEGDGFFVRIAYSKAWDVFPDYAEFKASSADEALRKFIGLSESPYPKSVLITRKLPEQSLLKQAGEKLGFHLMEQPFIELKPTAKADLPDADWIFFTSPSAVEIFASQYDRGEMKVAVLGEGTYEVAKRLFDKIEFVGKDPLPANVAEEFNAVIDPSHKILFPSSDISKGTVADLVQAEVLKHVLYSTMPHPKTLESRPDCIIFTSPSNVDGFLAANSFTGKEHVIAIGNTTSESLTQNKVPHQIASSPSEVSFLSLLRSDN